MIRKLYMVLSDFHIQVIRKNINSFAASIAYFLFLSMVPMMILICTIIPFTPLSEQNLVNAITGIMPDTIDPLIISIVSDVYDKSAGVLSVAAIATVWSAGKGVLALIRGLNEVNEVEEKRNYFLLRTIASFYTLMILLLLLLSLILNVFGNVLLEMLLSSVPETRMVFDFFMNLRFILELFVLTLLFTVIYAVLPDKKMKFRYQIPGALFSSLVWIVFSWCFSIYVDTTKSYSTYGSLSFIIIIMLWMYFCSYIILIGAQINRYFGPTYKTLFFRKRRKK